MPKDDPLAIVAQFLYENGLHQTLEALREESGVEYEAGEMSSGRLFELIAQSSLSAGVAGMTLADRQRREDDDALLLGTVSTPLVAHEDRAFENVHASNILTVRVMSARPPSAPPGGAVLVTGGADRCVVLSDAASGARLGSFAVHKAGVLAVHPHPHRPTLLLSSSMDGTHALVDAARAADSDDDAVVRRYADHRKFVVRAQWSPDGRWFATASYDQSVCLYGPDEPYDLMRRFTMRGNVEALAFLPDASALIIASRDDSFLHYIHLPSLEATRHNLNANGDDFVSMTVLDLACHPNGKYVSAFTDRGRLVVLRANSADQVANIYGLDTNGFSQPRHCWHPSGEYLFATTLERHIAVVNVKTQGIVQLLRRHVAVVRDLYFDAPSSTLFSVGYDNRLVAWAVSGDSTDAQKSAAVVAL